MQPEWTQLKSELEMHDEGEYRCPRCKSPQLYVTARGFSVKLAMLGAAAMRSKWGAWAGTIGSEEPMIKCRSCGFTFYPRDYAKMVERYRPKKTREILWAIKFGLVFLFIIVIVIGLVTGKYLLTGTFAFLCVCAFAGVCFWGKLNARPEEPSKQKLQRGGEK